MMDCKALTTPMSSNLKLLSDASSETVDVTMYHQMIGSLMYLMNMIPDIFFCCEHLEPVPDRSETCSLDCCKAYFEVREGTVDYGLKYEVNKKINLEGYEDSYWVGSSIYRKRTLRCYFIMGSSVISWFDRMESCMVLSTTEEKDVAT